jgi:hypothetical protein
MKLQNLLKTQNENMRIIRNYDGVDTMHLAWLLSQPLNLRYLRIPCPKHGRALNRLLQNIQDDLEEVPFGDDHHEWVKVLHKDLVVEAICLDYCCLRDRGLLSRMHAFKGLKTLYIHFVNYWTDWYYQPLHSLQHLECPQLEHLAILSSYRSHFPLNRFPKLKTFYLKVTGSYYSSEFNCTNEDLEEFLHLAERNVFCFFEYPHTSLSCPTALSSIFSTICYYSYDTSLNPLSLIEWLILSALHVREFHGLSDPKAPFRLDLTALYSIYEIQVFFKAINSSNFLCNLNISLALNLHIIAFEHNYSTIDVPTLDITNLHFLEPDFYGNEDVQPITTIRLICACPHIIRMRIKVFIRHLYPFPLTYPKFINSHYSLFSYPSGSFENLILNRKGGPYGLVTLEKVWQNHNRAFVEEIAGFFEFSSALEEIEIQFHW